jgi:hypothetical protein
MDMRMSQTKSGHRQQSLILTKGEYPVIDLKANYGGRYRMSRDEGGDQLIPHKWGHFYAHSATEFACFIEGNNKFHRMQKQFPEIRVTQRGDEEIIFTFDPALFPKLATALKTSNKRRVSDSEKARLRHLSEIHSPFRKTPFPDRREEIA